MIIAISGVPGTGKTLVAEHLSKLIGAKVIELKKLTVPFIYDKKRKSRIVDIKDLQKAVNKKAEKIVGNIILESHLSHLLTSDMAIILRTSPVVLEKRLKKRKWSKMKIRENVEAELLDEITIESLEKHKKSKIIEIDTSKNSPRKIALLISHLLKKPKHRIKYLPGKIDWSEKYKGMILCQIS